jgi:hypothetical protein
MFKTDKYTTETTNNRDDQQRYCCLHTRTGSYDLRLSLAAASIHIHPQLHTKPTPRGRRGFQADPSRRDLETTRKSSATFPPLTPSSASTNLSSLGSRKTRTGQQQDQELHVGQISNGMRNTVRKTKYRDNAFARVNINFARTPPGWKDIRRRWR